MHIGNMILQYFQASGVVFFPLKNYFSGINEPRFTITRTGSTDKDFTVGNFTGGSFQG